MRKKDKLYTVNKWNQPAFIPEKKNLFSGLQLNPSQMQQLKAYNMSVGVEGIPSNLGLGALGSGGGNNAGTALIPSGGLFGAPTGVDTPLGLSKEVMGNLKAQTDAQLMNDYMDSKNFLGIAKKDNPFSKTNLQKAFSKDNLKAAGTGLATAGIGMAGSMIGNALSGGLSSKAGDVVGSVGSSVLGMAGTAIGGPLGGAIGSAVGSVLGGAVNGLFGESVDAAKLAEVNENIAKLNSFQSNASTFDEVKGPEAVSMDTDVYSGGLFNDVSDKNEELKRKLMAAKSFAERSVDNNIYNIADTQLNNALANYAAFGGKFNRFDIGGDMLDALTSNVDTRSDSTYQGYNPTPIRKNAGAMVGTNPISDLVGALDDVTSTTKNNPYIQMGTAPAPGRAANVTGALKSMVKPSFTKAVSNFKPTTQRNTNVLPIYAYGGNLFAGGGEANEYSTDYNPISDDYTPIISTDYQPLINTLKRDNTKFNVDDYAYRVQKLHPEITKEQVADLYNSTPYIGSDITPNRTAGAFVQATENNAGNRVMLYPNNAGSKVTKKNATDVMGSTVAHETNHLMTNILLGGHTDAEKDMLWDAYPSGFMFDEKGGDYFNEARATNAQLRQAISSKYGNATGVDLDKVIDSISDDELINMYGNINGYVTSDYKKHAKTRTGAMRKALKDVAFNNPDFRSMENMAAVGGLIDKKNAENKNQMINLFAGTPNGLFALGGDVQMHGADFTNGLISINAGGSHEQNPNDGVQLGVDPEGTPNLVEEGETVFDDYVYSNRILADAQTKEKFGLPRKKDITFADISKKLEKESSERPNDPISQAGLKAQMRQLADEQERQKQEMDAQRAKAAFEALSPEEQVAVMENAAQQEAMAEQAAMQQPSPEEIAIAQQQQAMADGAEAMVGQESQMNCFGGRINRFDNGGQAYTKMLNSLGFHTQKEFDDWAKENSIDFGDIWKDNPNTLSIDILGKLWSNGKFKEALKKKNPALAHAFETKGYDFGTYVPTSNSRATIQSISKGNWKATNGQGWFGSEDLAFKQATKGMSENEIKALTTEQLAKRMAKTDAYKNTSKWLENSDNALMYLNTLLNDPDTPDAAKKHALQYVKDGKWKDGYKYNYNDVFGKVRSTNPGTYWHTAMEANRGNEANNFVINEDGSIEPILGNVPTDWTSAGNYSWADENSDYTYNYYKRPAVAAKPEAAKTPEVKEAEEEEGVAPKHRPEWLRYAGLFGPAVGLGMMAAGVGRPDTAQLDAAVAGAGDVNTADWKPLGNYLTYRPLDIWFEQNRMDANARATDRAIMNSTSPSRMAGLLANGYNSQLASGDLYRKALEYNDNLRKQVAEFNRGTDQFNSEQYGATSRFNADAYNNARRANAQLRLQAAAQKMDADAGWYNSLYGNVAGLFKGIGDIGTENFRMNRIGEMAARGDFGTATDETYGFEPYLTRSNRKSKKNR